MMLKKGIGYLGISAVNVLLGYVSKLYMLTAFYSLLYYIDSKQGIPQWCFHLGGFLMFLEWFVLFFLINILFGALTEKKNTIQFYIVQILLSAGGFLIAFIVD